MKFRLSLTLLSMLCSPVYAPSAHADSTAAAMPDVQNYYTGTARAKSAGAIDSAVRAAKSGAFGQMPNIPTPTAGIDIDRIASQYREMNHPTLPADENLLIFVSTSIPMQTLVKLGQQAKQAGAVLVLRGLPGGLASGWTHAMAQLKPLAATGARVEINPDLFRLYSVTQVPTFMIAKLDRSRCATDSTGCAANLRLSGDVSLDYVLEKWADGSGSLAKVAQSHLNQLTGVQ